MSDRLNRGFLNERAGGGDKSPQLTPAVVPGQPDELWLTIMSHRLLRNGTLVQLEFREYPGYIMWVGGQGAAAAREALYLGDQAGDDPARWNGARVKVEKVTRQDTRNGGTVVKYVMAPADNSEGIAAKAEPEPAAARKLRARKPRRAPDGRKDHPTR